jgi:hypothetical protein
MDTNHPPAREHGPRDAPWLLFLGIALLLSLAASWHRWADPIVDVGREMNQPLRLANGETLYSDVRHIYGPLSPWLHALLFRLLGPSLTLLYADGIVTAAIVLALVYWLARRLMGPPGAAAATLNVMALCVFKPAGNYILPYSYNSLHGVALGLTTVALLTIALREDRRLPGAARADAPIETGRQRTMLFAAAGVAAGLTTLAKTEMGAAAVVTGVVAACLVRHPRRRDRLRAAMTFIGMAATVVGTTYAVISRHVGWHALAIDSWLLLYNMPPEIAYFNAQISGLANPLRSLERMLIAAAKIVILAALLAAVGRAVTLHLAHRDQDQRRESADEGAAARWRWIAGSVALAILLGLVTSLDPDKGPFLAMPFMLIGVIATVAWKLRSARSAQMVTLLTYSVYALVSLTRMLLHVRSGGAYASYLLPLSVVIFTYLWVGPFAGWFKDPAMRLVSRRMVVGLILAVGVLNSVVLGYRSRVRNTVPIARPRGEMVVEPDMGLALNQALDYIDRYTNPSDAIAVLPEGTALTFLSGRRNPLREEIITPGYLDDEAQGRAIQQLDAAATALILIPNRPTREFGPAVFGRDYCQRLMRWIEAHYTMCATFGPENDPTLQIGDRTYFVHAYCPRRDVASR